MSSRNREQTESINLNKETEGSCSNRSDNSSDNFRLDISTAVPSVDSTITGGHPPAPQTVGRHFFPPATATTTTTTMQFFQNSSSGQSMVKEENSISNMFCAMDDHSGFWPWLDQQQYNWNWSTCFYFFQSFYIFCFVFLFWYQKEHACFKNLESIIHFWVFPPFWSMRCKKMGKS